jgi:hypothetical protein
VAIGGAKTYDDVATGVRKFRDTDLGDMALQEPSAVAITGGSVTGCDLAPSTQAITEAGAIDLDAGYIDITGPATSTYAVTLAAPTTPGVVKVIEMTGTTSTNAVTLALTNVVGGSAATTATFNAAGETLTLISAALKWVVLDELGVTLA